MKNKVSLIVLLGGLSMSGLSLAECPTSLSVDEIVSCIVTEGAGDIHPESEFSQSSAEQQTIKTSRSNTVTAQEQLAKKDK